MLNPDSFYRSCFFIRTSFACLTYHVDFLLFQNFIRFDIIISNKPQIASEFFVSLSFLIQYFQQFLAFNFFPSFQDLMRDFCATLFCLVPGYRAAQETQVCASCVRLRRAVYRIVTLRGFRYFTLKWTIHSRVQNRILISNRLLDLFIGTVWVFFPAKLSEFFFLLRFSFHDISLHIDYKGLFTPSGSGTTNGRVTLIYTCAIHTKHQRQHHPNPFKALMLTWLLTLGVNCTYGRITKCIILLQGKYLWKFTRYLFEIFTHNTAYPQFQHFMICFKFLFPTSNIPNFVWDHVIQQ